MKDAQRPYHISLNNMITRLNSQACWSWYSGATYATPTALPHSLAVCHKAVDVRPSGLRRRVQPRAPLLGERSRVRRISVDHENCSE